MEPLARTDAVLADGLARKEPVAVTAAQGKLAVKVLGSLAEIASHEADWRMLEAATPTPCLFQSFDWCMNFARHAAERNEETFEVFVVSRDGQPVAILPLAIRMNQGIRVLTGMSEPFQQYTDMLVSRSVSPRAAFKAMLPVMRSRGADYLHFGQVRADSVLAQAIEGTVPVSGEKDAAPYVQLSDWPSFEDYQKSINAKTRKNMRNARNRLERDAPVSHEVAHEGAGLAGVIDRSFEGREAWLERQGLTSRAFRDTGFGEFVARFKDQAQSGVDTVAFSLRHGDKPIADQWGFIHKGRYYAFMAGWDNALEESSPGKMHLGCILEACHAEGLDCADFMIPAARYKFTWAREATPVHDHVMPLTLRGTIHNRVWLDFLRPLAKKLAYAIPPKLRAWLFRLLLPASN
ncbi:MAG: GNAT family N-acetyltransferase [Rhizobiaceae bacterium]